MADVLGNALMYPAAIVVSYDEPRKFGIGITGHVLSHPLEVANHVARPEGPPCGFLRSQSAWYSSSTRSFASA